MGNVSDPRALIDGPRAALAAVTRAISCPSCPLCLEALQTVPPAVVRRDTCIATVTEIPFFFFLNLMFIFERVRQSASKRGAEREGDTESEAGSRLRAVSTEPDVELEPTDHEIMT